MLLLKKMKIDMYNLLLNQTNNTVGASKQQRYFIDGTTKNKLILLMDHTILFDKDKKDTLLLDQANIKDNLLLDQINNTA